MKIISLGWGVQSFTLAAMSALGELEPVDFAIHADTLHESQLTYEFAARWTEWLGAHGVKVVTVKSGGENNPVDNGWGWTTIPVFANSEKGGLSQRQCTFAWKIRPIRRWIQKNRNGSKAEQWIGISLDEWRRMKDNDVKYITNRWPLIEKKMTRADCVKWLENNGMEIPPRSSCVFCPFHTTREWRGVRSNSDDWAKAVRVDQNIRYTRPPYHHFLHPSRKPLEEVDLRTETEKGQLSLWDAECSGICGV